MYEQVKALKAGKSVDKPIYNHVTGILDPAERIDANKIVVIEGLHPFYDERVRDLVDFKIYLDISDEIKFAWKIQRDMAERGHSLESIKASIESRKPDFAKFVDPQKKHADMIIQVLPTQLVPGDQSGKILRVRLVMKNNNKLFDPAYLFDEGSTISWVPCGKKLACSYPGIKFFYGEAGRLGLGRCSPLAPRADAWSPLPEQARTPGTARTSRSWRWMASSTSWRRSSTSSPTCPTRAPSSTGR